MKKVLIAVTILFIVLITAFLLAYPHIEIDTGEKIIRFSYSDDFSEYDDNHSYNETYAYNEKHDVSIKSFEVKSFLCFHTIHMEYVEGDVRDWQFFLDESYIENFIENAEIYDNEKNIDLAKLIEGKTAVVGNRKYNAEEKDGIYYTLDGEDGEMYVFYVDDLLVIQVGSPDESPRYIAYK